MSVFQIAFLCLSFLIFVACLVPLSKNGHWFIRAFDFPRIPFATINLILLLSVYSVFNDGSLPHILFGVLLSSLLLDLYRIYPYIPGTEKQSPSHDPINPDGYPIKLVSANVLIENRNSHQMDEIIKNQEPDIISIVEADHFWHSWAKTYLEDYPHQVNEPRENSYGIVLMSRFPIQEKSVQYRIDERVPSVTADLSVPDYGDLRVYIIHPRPPRPKEGPSDQRDAELMEVAEEIAGLQQPVVVVGDLNDVSWSHTSRLFLRESGLLDPRQGRGVFNTIPASMPWLGFPLDHIFHSEHFTFGQFQVLRNIGSDHRPVFAKLYLSSNIRKFGNPKSKTSRDQKDKEKFKEKGRQWDGPNEYLNP